MLLELPTIVKPVFNGVIQIGAHYGAEHKKFRTIGCSKFVYFEPHPTTFGKLQENIASVSQPGEVIAIRQVAIGPRGGPNVLFTETANSGQSNSLLRPKTHAVQYPNIKFDGQVEVDVVPLDDVMSEFPDRADYDFISIDVQGFELEALKTGVEQLKHTKAILAEVNRVEMYEGCCLVRDIEKFLSEHGFEFVRVSWAGVTWGDGLFVRKDCREEVLF